MNLFTLLFLVVTVSFYIVHTESTICAPYSTFKIDCEDCQCSEDGTQYACEAGNCAPGAYLNKNNADGDDNSIRQEYPRQADFQPPIPYGNDDNSIRQEYPRQADIQPPIPYGNDEIPPSREIDEGGDDDDAEKNAYNYYIVAEKKDSDDSDNDDNEEINNVGLEDQEVIDPRVPDNYRQNRDFRRFP